MSAVEAFCSEIGSIEHTADPATVRRKSRDQFTISPLLRESLAGKSADVVVTPRSKDEIRSVIRAAVRQRLPITVRGGGTANYGQSVPLEGGILLDITSYSGVLGLTEGTVRVLAGTTVNDIDAAIRPLGWELRIHPSTTETATIAGFIAGGSGGIGSAQWGMLRDRGNIGAVELLSVEEEPRIVELTGNDIELVHHAYGTNGIITEIEMPVAPAWTWHECLVAFDDFMDCARFGVRLGHELAIIKKVISLQEWPLPSYMRDLNNIIPEGCSMANCYVAQASLPAFRDLVLEHHGKIVADHISGENPFGAPLFEFAYGHGMRQIQKTNPKFTGFQGMFPPDSVIDSIAAVRAAAGPAQPMRLEIFWSEGRIVAMGSPVITYDSEAQMAAMVNLLQTHGAGVANSHTTGVREVGIKRITPRDAVFKREMDPHGLLNPGKLNLEAAVHTNLPTSGWSFRKAG